MSVASPNPSMAIALKTTSVLLFVVMASLIKAASSEVPPGEAVFFRSLFAMPVIVLWLAATGHLADGWRTKNPLGHLWRGLIGTTAMALSFAGLAILPLSEVKAIQYAAPILVVIFAALLLGERIRKIRITAVALGMAGVLIILWPRLASFSDTASDPVLALGALIVLAGSACAAMAQVFVRRLVETESASSIVFWFTMTSTGLSLLTLPFGWAMPQPMAFAALVGAGICGGVGQILLTHSYRYADVSVIAPFDYMSMLFALVIGYLLFEEVPTMPMLFGAALVISAGVLIILRERQLGLKRGRARATMPRDA